MVRITIDREMQQKLLSSGEVVELVDESGKLLGRLLPQIDDFPQGWKPIGPELTEEELQRRLDQLDETAPGISTEELLSRLRDKG